MESDRKKGRFTFRTAAALFILSAAFELLSITSEAPLFGEIRSGVSAGIYHIIYVVFFAALGIGLWGAKKWGYTLVFVTTALYTLDKLQFLLSQQAMDAFVTRFMSQYEGMMQDVDMSLIPQVIVLTTVLFVLCWWGFALYTYLRRDYFKTDSGT